MSWIPVHRAILEYELECPLRRVRYDFCVVVDDVAGHGCDQSIQYRPLSTFGDRLVVFAVLIDQKILNFH